MRAAADAGQRHATTAGPAIVNHYNLYPSAEINGNTAPGHQLRPGDHDHGRSWPADHLPSTMGFEWTELTYQQILAGKDVLTKLVFPLAVRLRASWCWRRSTRAGRCRSRSS